MMIFHMKFHYARFYRRSQRIFVFNNLITLHIYEKYSKLKASKMFRGRKVIE